jgi:hypothetical protein
MSLSREIKLILIYTAISFSLPGQNAPGFFTPDPHYNSGRVNGTLLTEGAVFTGAMVALDFLWYRKFPHSRFHFFNDNSEWLQMDKLGHATTVYNISALTSDVYQWSGIQPQRSAWMGGITGLIFMTTIEIFDGFSNGWGFSSGDMLANTAGSALAVGQFLGWNEQRIQLRFSYHTTIYPTYRPELLGENGAQRVIKDYNGQSYWLSANMYSFFGKGDNFPKWLNLDLGYGADGMTGGKENPANLNTPEVYVRQRRFFLSPDIDLARITYSADWATPIARGLNILKIPAPAVEFNATQKKVKLHFLYY